MAPLETAPELQSDIALAAALRAGSERALEGFLRSVLPRMKGMLWRHFALRPDSEIVADALSNAALRIWKGRCRYDPTRGTLAGYFAAIVMNECRRRLRVRKADALLEYRPAHELDGATTGARGSAEFSPRLSAFLDDLSPLERRIAAADLRHGTIVPAAELAAELGTTKETVYSLRNRVKAKAREFYRGKEDRE